MEKTIEAFVLTYNRCELIKESIISLINQTIGEIKITVMDNGSTDSTKAIVEEMQKTYKNIHYHYRNGGNGCIGNFKEAISLANADYVIFFHDDDILHPDYFKYALEAINKFSNAALISCVCKPWENPDNNNFKQTSSEFYYFKNKKKFVNYMFAKNAIAFPSIIYKTKNLKEMSIDIDDYLKYGKLIDRPLLINSLKDEDGAVVFTSLDLLRYRFHKGQDSIGKGPFCDEIIEHEKFYKSLIEKKLISKWVFYLYNFKRLKELYEWGGDDSISFKEFINKTIKDGAGSCLARMCLKYAPIRRIVKILIKAIGKNNFGITNKI